MFDPVIFGLSMVTGGFVGGAIAGVLFSHRSLVQQLRDVRAKLHAANKALVTAGVEKRRLQTQVDGLEAEKERRAKPLREANAARHALALAKRGAKA